MGKEEWESILKGLVITEIEYDRRGSVVLNQSDNIRADF
jgi:hypothetical protein